MKIIIRNLAIGKDWEIKLEGEERSKNVTGYVCEVVGNDPIAKQIMDNMLDSNAFGEPPEVRTICKLVRVLKLDYQELIGDMDFEKYIKINCCHIFPEYRKFMSLK